MNDTTFGVWSSDDPEDYQAWIRHWTSWPTREVQAHPDYARLYADQDRDRVCCAFYRSDVGNVLFPFIMRDVSSQACWSPDVGEATDIITPYGYGGPFCWAVQAVDDLSQRFWPAFNAWAAKNQVITEFVRFSLFHENVLPYPGEKRARLVNVVRSLDLDEEALWMDVQSKVRRNVRKARRLHVAVEMDERADRFEDFFRIYNRTMDRRSAASTYYFPRSFFEQIHQRLAGQFCYFHAVYHGKVIASELVLTSVENTYFFLGGTDQDYYELRPNDLLKFEIIVWARRMGKKRYVLGGGHAPDDGIFRYKKAFAPNGLTPFYVGERVLDEERYRRLVDGRSRGQRTGNPPASGAASYFPAYRAA